MSAIAIMVMGTIRAGTMTAIPANHLVPATIPANHLVPAMESKTETARARIATARASDPKVGTGFGKNPILKQEDRAAAPNLFESIGAHAALVARF
jgi:hypothetical protein